MALYTLQEEPETPLDPSNNPCHNPFHGLCHDPLNESKRCIYDSVNLQLNNPLINDPISSFLRSPAYLDQEDDEFADDMALHEPPVLKPPHNSPNSQSVQESPNSSTNLAPYATMEEYDYLDSDEFEDSVDIMSMTLHSSLAECEKAMALFFNNRLDDAVAVMTPWKETSLYHAHGAAIFEFIPAVLTLEPEQIQRAQDAVRHTFTLCGQLRRMYTFTQSIGAIIKKPNYGGYTEEEAHAELVNAEALLLLACLGIIENEDMTGFLKASLRVKSSYNAYRMCAKILARKCWEDEASRAHFESGVRLGLATFNVMIATLPPRIVTLLEFVGFSADKRSGESELLKAAESTGLRSVLCELTLLVYYLIIGHFAAIPPDFGTADKIISKSLKKYPNSVWFLMFKARSQLLRGKIVDSIITYQKTCKTKNLWPQMKHLAYWELVWAFAMLRQWTNAAEYASLLEHDSKWSRTIYMYAQAAMLIENKPQTPAELMCVDGLLRNAPCHRQRLLGRSLPMEKFVVRRCERWSRRGYLVLPGVEWLYLWNIFPSLAADRHHADAILKIIERTKEKIIKSLDEKEDKESTKKTIKKNKTDETDKSGEDYDHDDLALTEFLQGSLLSAMALPRLALQNLETVIEMKDNIKEHTFLLPYATVEIASCYYQFGNSRRAIEILQDARKKYSGYLLEARLQFRIHSKLEYIHAGVNFVRKPFEASSVLDTVRKARPRPSTSTSDEAGPSTNTTDEAGPSSSANTPRVAISEIHAGELHSRVKVSKASTVSTGPRAGPSSTVATDMDSLSIVNPVPGPSSRTNALNPSSSLSVSAEPMPTSSYLGPPGSAHVNINVVVEENVCETESSANTSESFDSATNEMPEPRAGKSDMPEECSATSDMPERSSANSDMLEWSSANSDVPERPSANSDMPERPSTYSDMPDWPSANSDMPERPSANSGMPERPSTNSDMPECCSVRCDMPKQHPAKSVIFEMDVLAAAGAEPTATGSGAGATAEATKKQKWLR